MLSPFAEHAHDAIRKNFSVNGTEILTLASYYFHPQRHPTSFEPQGTSHLSPSLALHRHHTKGRPRRHFLALLEQFLRENASTHRLCVAQARKISQPFTGHAHTNVAGMHGTYARTLSFDGIVVSDAHLRKYSSRSSQMSPCFCCRSPRTSAEPSSRSYRPELVPAHSSESSWQLPCLPRGPVAHIPCGTAPGAQKNKVILILRHKRLHYLWKSLVAHIPCGAAPYEDVDSYRFNLTVRIACTWVFES